MMQFESKLDLVQFSSYRKHRFAHATTVLFSLATTVLFSLL